MTRVKLRSCVKSSRLKITFPFSELSKSILSRNLRKEGSERRVFGNLKRLTDLRPLLKSTGQISTRSSRLLAAKLKNK